MTRRALVNPGFTITPHTIDAQLKSLYARMDEEEMEQWADTVGQSEELPAPLEEKQYQPERH